MEKNEKNAIFISESIKSTVNMNQFYQDSSIDKSLGTLTSSESDKKVSFIVDTVDVNREKDILTVSFDCNPFIAGRIIVESFSTCSIMFENYPVEFKISSTKDIKTKFISDDLCNVVMTFSTC